MSRLRQVATMPRQSLTAMKVAFGIRAQYTTIAMLSILMLTQVIGVVIFSGKAQAIGSVTYEGEITQGFGEALASPDKIAMAPDDSFYVATTAGDKIYKYNSSNVATGVIGSVGSGDGQFDGVRAMAVDQSGNLFIFDAGNTRVQKFDSNGNFITKWGSQGSGDGQFGTGFGYWGIAIAPNGNVFVTDGGANQRIQVFSNDGAFLYKWSRDYAAGLAINPDGTVLVCGVGGGPQLYTSRGVDLDDSYGGNSCYHAITVSQSGDIYYISSSLNVIKQNHQRKTATFWAGSGGSHLGAIAVNSQGKVYITSSHQNKITIYDDNSAYLEATTQPATNLSKQSVTLNGIAPLDGVLPQWVTERGFQIGTTTDYELSPIADTSVTKPALASRSVGAGNEPYQVGSPFNFSIDANGNYYVTDSKDPLNGDYAVKKFGPSGTTYLGGVGLEGDGDGLLNEAWETAFDSAGNIYVVDAGVNPTNRIQKFNSSGVFVDSWGVQGTGDGQFMNASAIAIDSKDNIYVSDLGLDRIQKFDSSGNFITKWGSDGDGAGLGDGEFTYPDEIAVGADDTIYVLNSAGDKRRVQRFTNDGTYISQISSYGSDPNQLLSPVSFAVSGNDIYIVDDREHNDGVLLSVVKKFTTSGDYLGTLNLKREDGSVTRAWDIKVNAVGDLVVLDPNSTTQAIYTYKINEQTITGTFTNIECGVTYHYRAYATNTLGTDYGDDQTFVACTPMEITTDWLPDGDLAQPYSAQIETNILGTGSINAEVIDGAMPTGLSLDPVTGEIDGAPTESGNFTFTIQVTDGSSYNTGSDQETYYMYVSGQALQVTESSDTAYAGSSYSDQVEVTGGLGDTRSFSVDSGQLPPGLTMNSSGLISGTPTTAGEYTARVEVIEGILTAYGDITIDVIGYNPVEISGTTLSAGRVGIMYSSSGIVNSVDNGFGYKSFEITSGSLPSGVVLDSDGYLHGSPTAAGTYIFTVEVSDLTGSASDEFTLTIQEPLPPRTNTSIVTITSPANNAAFDYTQDSIAVSGTGPINQTITVFMDNYQLGTTTTDGSGSWNYTVSNVFPGNHTFDAKWIPASDVAFVTNIDIETYTADILAINTSDQSVMKTIHLPTGVLSVFASATVNHAGTKLYIPAFDAFQGNTVVLEYDIASGSLTRRVELWPAPYLTSSVVVSADDSYAYIANADSGGAGHPGPFAEYQKIDLASFTAVESPIVLEGQTTSQVVTGAIVGGAMVLHNNSLYSAVSITDATDPFTASVINLINSSVSSFEIDDQPLCDLCQPRIYGTADRVYYIANNQLVVVNPDNGSVIKTIALSSVVEDVDAAFTLVVDANDQKAYISAYAINTDNENPFDYNARILSVDLSTDVVTDITPVGIADDNVVTGLALANNDAQLYLQHLRGDVVSMNITTGETQAVTNVFADPDAAAVYHTGSYYVGHVDPVMASVVFSVGMSPNVTEAIKICSGNQKESIPVNQSYSRQTCTTGGSGPKTFTLGLDPLPPGLSLNSVTGEITGTPTTPGAYDFALNVADSTGSDMREYTIVVLPPEDPTISNVTPPATPVAKAKSNPIKAPQTVVAAQNNIFALAKRIPEPFAIGFPWVLLALALILVGTQYYQVHSESASTKRMQQSVAKQERLVEEQNNFVALSTHYLHTPLTVMEGEISLMVKAGTLTQAEATKLKANLASLNAEAEAALAQEEQSEVE